MTPIECFLWGFAGSCAMEVLAALPLFQSQPIQVPERYHRKSFWLIRLLLAIISGGLALAYDVQSKLLAINVGASAPLVLQALAQGISSIPTVSPQHRPGTGSQQS
jgi:hypothetical protein